MHIHRTNITLFAAFIATALAPSMHAAPGKARLLSATYGKIGGTTVNVTSMLQSNIQRNGNVLEIKSDMAKQLAHGKNPASGRNALQLTLTLANGKQVRETLWDGGGNYTLDLSHVEQKPAHAIEVFEARYGHGAVTNTIKQEARQEGTLNFTVSPRTFGFTPKASNAQLTIKMKVDGQMRNVTVANGKSYSLPRGRAQKGHMHSKKHQSGHPKKYNKTR